MDTYKGYVVDQSTARVVDGKLTHVTYSILRYGMEVHREMLTGPFTHEEASAAVESAARKWIDQLGS